MNSLIDNSEYKISYLVNKNVDIYNVELCEEILIIFEANRRKSLIRNKNGDYVPSPYFKSYENVMIPFNLCYLLYSENTAAHLLDCDFEIGFNWADINFEEQIVEIMRALGYYYYYIIDGKINLKKEEYLINYFDGFIFSLKPLYENEFNDCILNCSDLNGIRSALSLNAVMFFKVKYYANYNYILYFDDKFDIVLFLSKIKEIYT